jgi:hypothetical protein
MSRLRRQDGFTLPEMLSALIVGMIVVIVAMGLLDFTIRRSGEIAGRVEASQKGRAAMDTMTQHLRSQVCLTSTTPPIATGDANSVSFYADLTDGSTGEPPERHIVTYDPGKRLLVEEDYEGTRAVNTVSYSATWDRKRQLAHNVVPETAGGPIFKYYAFDNTVTPPRPTVLLPTPLSPTDRARTVRMEIAFRVLPVSARKDALTARGDVVFRDDVYVRAADPDDPRDVRPPDPDDEIPPVCT